MVMLFSDNNDKIHVFALSWRDIKAPKAGGAEVLSQGIFKRMLNDKYEIIHLSPKYNGATMDEDVDGVRYIRRGNIVTVLWYAFFYYLCNRNDIDYIIDQCNTHRFFTPLYVSKDKRILFIHQLTREIWDINARFPLSWVGKRMETPLLRMYRRGKTLTVSESTKKDLVDIGFDPEKIYIMPNGIDQIIHNYQRKMCLKETNPTFIYVGRYTAYKGIDICIESFAIVKKSIPAAKLWLVGKENQEYISEKLGPLCKKNNLKLKYADDRQENIADGDIIIWGFVSEDKKYELMKRATLLLFPSIREGWGIIITEAALLGTPSLVCDAPGMRDAVDNGNAGFMCSDRTPSKFAEMMKMIATDQDKYAAMQKSALGYSENFIWDEENQTELLTRMEKSIFPRRKDQS